MNRKQKVYVALCSVLFCLMIFFPPFVMEGWLIPGVVYAPVWNRPIVHPEKVNMEGTLCTELLVLQLVVLLVFAVVGLVGLADRNSESRGNIFHR